MISESISVAFAGRTGRTFDQIVRLAREVHADLVLCPHGRTAVLVVPGDRQKGRYLGGPLLIKIRE